MSYDNARRVMEGFCQVCPRCDGRACAGKIPGMGGTETAATFRNNITVLENIRVNMRTIYGGNEAPDTSLEIFGKKLALPVLPAPISGVRFNFSHGPMTELEYNQSLLKQTAGFGTLACTGDGAVEEFWQSGLAALQETPAGIPFLKPWDDETVKRKIAMLPESQEWIGMDVDSVGLSNVTFMGGSIPLRSYEDMKRLFSLIPQKKIIKGVMTPDEALAYLELGADALVVSNHGGRIIDGCPGTAEVLPDIADAVQGAVPLLIDGGIRSGLDILKVLALGADAVLIGRPVIQAIMENAQTGLIDYLKGLQAQLKKAMTLTACQNLSQIGPQVIF